MLKQFPWSNIKEWSSHLFLYIHLCVQAKLLQSCMTLWDLRNCNLPGSSVHGILQETILEWVAVSSSRGSSRPRDRTQVSCISGGFFTVWATGNLERTISTTVPSSELKERMQVEERRGCSRVWPPSLACTSVTAGPESGLASWGLHIL